MHTLWSTTRVQPVWKVSFFAEVHFLVRPGSCLPTS